MILSDDYHAVNAGPTSLTEQHQLAYNLFHHDSGVIEVRAFIKGKGSSPAYEGWGKTVAGYFNDPDAFIAAMARLDKERRVTATYIMMNPVLPALIHRSFNRLVAVDEKDTLTNDSQIVTRHRLLIDTDPYRPSKISSTDDELAAAKAARAQILEYLNSLGFPAFALGDSGNGAHAIGAIDLPNTPESTTMIGDFLAALNWKFGSVPSDEGKAKADFAAGKINVAVDTTVHNAARITKLYGSVARKGDNTPVRPHRRSRLTYVPEQLVVIPAELLERVIQEHRDHQTSATPVLAIQAPPATPRPTVNGNWSATVDGVEQWLQAAGVKLGARAAYTSNGYEYKWDVDCLTSSEHKDGAFICWGANKGLGYTCHHNSCKGRSWADVRAIISPKPPAIGKQAAGESQPGRVASWMTALEGLGYDLRLNLLEDMVEVDGDPLNDVMRSKITLQLFDAGVTKSYVDDLLNVAANQHAYHPIRQYLTGLQWDGQPRLIRLLNCIRGDDTVVTYSDGNTAQLHWLIIRRWLLGCVARGLDGDKRQAFKHQTPMLVIIGKQGLGKSSLIRWLVSGAGYEFHREGPINPHNTDDIRCMVTRWIWEVSELGSSLRKSDRDALKGFITQEWHTYRKPWGKAPITKPTLCNLVGTINPETGFLDDPTGHRRFLPVRITKIDRGYSDIDVNQLWAEIVHMYQAGESPELSPLERKALAATYQEHEVENPLQTYLQMYFNIEPGNSSLKMHTAGIMERLKLFGINVSQNARVAGREINDALAPMGLERKLLSIDGAKGWGWLGIQPNNVQPPSNINRF